eukprot:5748-Heterococcus_DN1.PRE.5
MLYSIDTAAATTAVLASITRYFITNRNAESLKKLLELRNLFGASPTLCSVLRDAALPGSCAAAGAGPYRSRPMADDCASQSAMKAVAFYNEAQSFDSPPYMTLLRTAFASPSVLRVAHAAGLPLEDSSARLQRAAGFFADQSTLLAAYELGLQCTGSVVNGIAASGCLHKMASVCTHFPRQILDEAAWYAASSGSIDMLKLLQQKSIPIYNHHTMGIAHKYGHSKLYDYKVALGDSPML